MLALAEILALIILNALIQAAFARWKIARRVSGPKRRAKAPIAFHYPLHPSPAAHIRPAGVDW